MTMIKQYKKIKVCLFDFDGTLVDTMGQFADLAGSIIEKAYNIAFEKARQLYLDTSGIPFFQQLEVLFPERADNPLLAQDFEERKIESFFSESFSEDTIKSMNALKAAGFKIGISSNNFQNLVEQFVQREEIGFDYVLGFKENFAKGKDHFFYVIEKANCQAEELLFVGDSLKDAEKAEQGGVQFIGKLGTFSQENFHKKFPGIDTISKLEELVEIITT